MRYKKSWKVIGFVAVTLLLLAIVAAVIKLPPGEPSHPAETTPVVEGPLPKTDLKRVRDWFGPWQMAKPGTTGAPALVMLLGNGSTDVSSWRADVDKAWTASTNSPIQAATATDGRLKIRTDSGQIFTLAYGQPFILERFPGTVYAFRVTASKQFDLVTTTAARVHRSGHNL